VNIVVLGPQGSGKGTQAKKIAHTYGIPHVATGDMIREMKEIATPAGQELKGVYDRGDLVSDDLMIRLIAERLDRGDTLGGHVLDGFPRTLVQAEALDDLLSELGRSIDIVFDFQVNAGGSAAKLLQRVLNELGAKPPLSVDGDVGAGTMSALNAVDQNAVYRAYKQGRIAYYQDLVARRPALGKFLNGWLKRVNSFPELP